VYVIKQPSRFKKLYSITVLFLHHTVPIQNYKISENGTLAIDNSVIATVR